MIQEITIQKLYELYTDTITICQVKVLNETDEIIEYNIFEEFATDIISFLHEKSLQRLYENELISKEKMQKSLILREKVLQIENSEYWNVSSVKRSEYWRGIFELSSEIQEM